MALNNVAVDLLERGCYREGMEILQEAIAILRGLFKREELLNGESITNADIIAKLQDARDKARQSSQQPQIISPDIQLQTLSYGATGLAGILSLLGPTPTSHYYLVRLDIPLECPSVSVSSTADFGSSILLYNFGIAHLLMSRLAHIDRRLLMVENANAILHISSSIVARRSTACCDAIEETALLQMGLLVLHSLIQVLRERNMDASAATVMGRYATVRELVGNLQDMTAWYSSLLVSAPAA